MSRCCQFPVYSPRLTCPNYVLSRAGLKLDQQRVELVVDGWRYFPATLLCEQPVLL